MAEKKETEPQVVTIVPKPAVTDWPDNIPVAQESVSTGTAGSVRPKLEDYDGEYIRKSDGETYALAVVEDDPSGKTHNAINTLHFWEGTEEQFKVEFAKEGEPFIEKDHQLDAFHAREKDRAKTTKESKHTTKDDSKSKK